MSDVTDPRIEAIARARFNHTREKVLLEKPGISICQFEELHEKDQQYWAEGVVDELKAADAAAWRPIESAPKNGTCILVPVKHIGADVVSWYMYGWRETSNCLLMRDPPTHWMPLPPPPKMGGRDDAS